MIPTLTLEVPINDEWFYEVKYDGFRAIFLITEDSIQMTSRNERDLTVQFPELISYVERNWEQFAPFTPLVLDGEIVALENEYKSDFDAVQRRGKLRSQEKIVDAVAHTPCSFVCFDLLTLNGNDMTSLSYGERRSHLVELFTKCHLPLKVCPHDGNRIHLIESTKDFDTCWKQVVIHEGEGILAKQRTSQYAKGSRTKQWLKMKNYRKAKFVIVSFDESNGYFHVAVHQQHDWITVGTFTHGLSSTERNALVTIIKQNGKKNGALWEIPPSICIQLQFLSFSYGQLREPSFHSFSFESSIEECSFFQLLLSERWLHPDVTFTHLQKPLWKETAIQKEDYLQYLVKVAPRFLPFLQKRLLTVVRYPHGLYGEAFFQKNCPDYAPAFIQTVTHEGISYIHCNDFSTLMWLGNQLAIEFHIPFNSFDTEKPREIVFDLDPPNRAFFHLAIKAALELKACFDTFHVQAYPKLSGNKGIQLHIPLTKNKLTYDETRIFTSFFARYLVERFPDLFTTERLKKNRGDRLYVDYIQHAEGKTIIAPYSVRGTEEGTVAAPLYWEEINDSLRPETMTMEAVMKRMEAAPCPMQTFFQNGQDDVVHEIIEHIKQIE